MPKKGVGRRRTQKTTKPSVFSYRRIVIFVSAFVLALGFLAFFQTHMWSDFITGKEQFLPNDPTKTVGYFDGEEVQAPPLLSYNPEKQAEQKVLGDTSNKRVEVDLTNQRVYAFEGDNKVYDFLVSTGRFGWTPTGTFTIERKVRAQTMKGGNKALGTYYYLPNVQFVQFFGNSDIPWWRGFSFHGTYWHNNFGTPMSHGCINMTNADAETLYNFTDIGTQVVIYGRTPGT